MEDGNDVVRFELCQSQDENTDDDMHVHFIANAANAPTALVTPLFHRSNCLQDSNSHQSTTWWKDSVLSVRTDIILSEMTKNNP